MYGYDIFDIIDEIENKQEQNTILTKALLSIVKSSNDLLAVHMAKKALEDSGYLVVDIGASKDSIIGIKEKEEV